MSRPRRTVRFFVAGIATTSIVLLFVLYSLGPVLLTISPRATAVAAPPWVLLNPLRDRRPERTAERLLESLRAGRAQEVFARLRLNPPVDSATVDDELKLRVLSWRLVARKDYPDRVELSYSSARTDYPTDPNRRIFMAVRRGSRTAPWVVISYVASY